MLTPLTKEQVYAHAGKARATPRTDRRYFYHFRKAVLGFTGVAIGTYVVIQSVIALSAVFHISEYLISFFVVAIGTSLPELVVDLTAIRKRQYVKEATNIAL